MSTDNDWKKWGDADPYYGVLSNDKYRSRALTADARRQFFETGVEHVNRILRTIFNRSVAQVHFRSVLDFGCGVGRLLIPLAEHADIAVGVDVSSLMLTEAATAARKSGAANVELRISEDNLGNVTERFTLVHSCLVFQHIPPHRGRHILTALATKVAPGGYIAVQLLTRTAAGRLVRTLTNIRYAVPPIHWLRNAIKRRTIFEPVMQLHVYDLAAIVSALHNAGFAEVKIYDEPCEMHDFTSVYVVAQRRIV